MQRFIDSAKGDLSLYERALSEVPTVVRRGTVNAVRGLAIFSSGPSLPVGAVCRIETDQSEVNAQVVAFGKDGLVLIPLEKGTVENEGSVIAERLDAEVNVGFDAIGRVLDGTGSPLDGRISPVLNERWPFAGRKINTAKKKHVAQALDVGTRSINAFLSIGRGQKVGIFSGSGVGKSVLLGMMARHTEADIVICALIGERSREVREFLDRIIGERLKKAVIIAAPQSDPAPLKVRAALLAACYAEYFRDQGLNILVLFDSLTRLCMAQREIAISFGEPPQSRGYPSSAFTLLSNLLDRVGNSELDGTLTGIFTVLVEGDDLTEPVADAARSMLDGHIVLNRSIAEKGLYPAVDILASISRCMPDLVDRRHLEAASTIRRLVSIYRDSEDLIRVGAYQKGSDPELDLAIALRGDVESLIRQGLDEKAAFAESVAALFRVANKAAGDA